jgi:mono/diheme cytochrome c family protein
LRQLALLVLLLLIWGGGFSVFVGATSSSGAAPVAEVPPTSTSAPVPTATPIPTATHAPSPVSTATTAATANPTATIPPTDDPPPAPATVTPSAADDAAISFQRDVQPIFNQICVKCHGGEEVKEGLSLKSYGEVMRGSDNGPIVVPGDPDNSFLIEQIVKGEMPKRGPKLLPAQIRAITNWVAAGAPNN